MEIGIDSFAAVPFNTGAATPQARAKAIEELLERIAFADSVGIDLFGIGEHHRQEFFRLRPTHASCCGSGKNPNIKLTSAVAVLSAADPVRVFQNYATLDLISEGRTEMVVGRGSFTESFPLFGLRFEDYDALFDEKLKLLLQIRKEEQITWSGKFSPGIARATNNTSPLPKHPAHLGGCRRYSCILCTCRTTGVAPNDCNYWW